MILQEYLRVRWERAQWQPRQRCPTCKKPKAACYCGHIRPFSPEAQFVLLIHHREMRRSIATGRMAHLCLSNSILFEGTDFSEHEGVNALLRDPRNHPVLLYPGPDARDLADRQAPPLCPPGKRLVVFLVDATWGEAKRMKRLSRNLAVLPQVRFVPRTPSRFVVRKQPHAGCYATIEAIHEFIELTAPHTDRLHDNLLEVFQVMVDHQLRYEEGPRRLWRTHARLARISHQVSSRGGGDGRLVGRAEGRAGEAYPKRYVEPGRTSDHPKRIGQMARSVAASQKAGEKCGQVTAAPVE